jgi:hypothetical protein
VGVSLFLALVLLLSACGIANQEASGQEPSLTSRLDAFFASEVKEKVFSGSVLIAKGGNLLLAWSTAFMLILCAIPMTRSVSLS